MSQQVDFYLLGNMNQVGKFTYACRIAEKAFKQGLTVYMHTENSEQSQQLDALLWTFSQGGFVPHVRVKQGSESWENFPVQLSENLSDSEQADLLISLTADSPSSHTQFKRIADLIIDDPDEKQSGRHRFKFYRDQGIEPNTLNIG